MKAFLRVFFISGVCSVTPLRTSNALAGAVITDGTLGRATTLAGPNYSIPATLGQVRGGNLFQSFQTLNLSPGDIATFTGPATVTNVLARVTGGQSNIDGTLSCAIPNAAFYLINSAGVVFGPEAKLNVQGSFAVTTADYVKQGDGTRFVASAGPSSVLTTAPPAAFGFLGTHVAGPITVKGRLALTSDSLKHLPNLTPAAGNPMEVVGGTITVIGGSIGSTGTAQTTAVSVASGGELPIPSSGSASTIDTSGFSKLGLIVVAKAGFLGSDGGNLSLACRDLLVEGNSNNFLDLSSEVGSEPLDSGAAGSVRIVAQGEVTVSDDAVLGSDGGLSPYNTGDGAGAVTLTAHAVAVSNLSSLGSIAGQTGDADSVHIHTAGSIDVTGGGFVGSEALAPGGMNAGALTIVAGDVSVSGISSVIGSRPGSGDGGEVRIHAAGTIDVAEDAFLGSGDSYASVNAGPLRIVARNINVTGAGSLGSVSGSGVAGAVSINAAAAVNIYSKGFVGSDASNGGTSAGAVSVAADTLSVDGNVSKIASRSGSGSADAVSVDCNTVDITNGGCVRSITDSGNGGDVDVVAQQLTLSSDPILGLWASIYTLTSGNGNGGDVSVRVGDLREVGLAAIGAGAFSSGSAGSANVHFVKKFADKIASTPHVIELTPTGLPIDLTGPEYDLPEEVASQDGGNFFITLSRLSLAPFESLDIVTPASATDALARVTGNQVSAIDGRLTLTGSSADLYLMNPDGLVFGPRAELDLPGGLALTTADYIKLGKSGRFPASAALSTILSHAAPSALGFLESHTPAAITVDGAANVIYSMDNDADFLGGLETSTYDNINSPIANFQTSIHPATGSSLLVVGGPITVDGAELASSGNGQATVASVASAGEALLPSGISGGVDLKSFSRRGDISITDNGFLGTDALLDSTDAGGVTISAEKVSASGSSLLGSRSGALSAGAVSVNATGSVRVTGGSFIGSDSRNFDTLLSGTSSGPVTVVAGSVALSDTGTSTAIASALGSRSGSGNAGSVRLDVAGAVSVARADFLGSEIMQGGTAAGPVTITAGSVSVDSAELSSQAVNGGTAALASIHASGLVSITDGGFLGSDGQLAAGAVTVAAGSIDVTGANTVGRSELGSRSSNNSTAVSGAVNVDATDGFVTVTEGAFLGSDGPGMMAGPISVVSGGLFVEGTDDFGDPSEVASSALEGTASSANIASTGQVSVLAGGFVGSSGHSVSGAVQVRAGNVLLDGTGSPLPDTGIFVDGELNGGERNTADLAVTASRSLTVRDGASVSADSFSATRAGTVKIVSPSIVLNQGSITARSFSGGGGGSLTIDANTLSLQNSTISAETYRGASTAAQVEVRAGTITANDDSSISASAGGGLQLPLTVEDNLGSSDAFANTFLISPSGARVLLANMEFPQSTTYADNAGQSATTVAPLGFLSQFVAGDLDGIWKLEIQSLDGTVIKLHDWNLFLGDKRIGGSSTVVEGDSIESPTAVSGKDPLLTGGNGGNTIIHAGNVSLAGGSNITAGTVGSGDAGGVHIHTKSLEVSGSDALHERSLIGSTSTLPPFGTASDKSGLGAAGGVDITASGSVALRNGGQLSVQEAGDAAGGNIRVDARSLSLSPYSGISAASRGLVAGDNGGNITIGPTILALFPALQPGAISANAVNGNGGNITVASAGEVLASDGITPLNEFTASGTKPGTVAINSPEVDLTGELAPLISAVVQSGTSLAPTCGMQVGPSQSSFTLEGGNGLPTDPGELVPHGPKPTTRP